jgi:hypothetical protein
MADVTVAAVDSYYTFVTAAGSVRSKRYKNTGSRHRSDAEQRGLESERG